MLIIPIHPPEDEAKCKIPSLYPTLVQLYFPAESKVLLHLNRSRPPIEITEEL